MGPPAACSRPRPCCSSPSWPAPSWPDSSTDRTGPASRRAHRSCRRPAHRRRWPRRQRPSRSPPQSPVGAGDELLLRVQYGGGGPTSPTDLLPWVSLMADGTLVWQPDVAPEPNTHPRHAPSSAPRDSTSCASSSSGPASSTRAPITSSCTAPAPPSRPDAGSGSSRSPRVMETATWSCNRWSGWATRRSRPTTSRHPNARRSTRWPAHFAIPRRCSERTRGPVPKRPSRAPTISSCSSPTVTCRRTGTRTSPTWGLRTTDRSTSSERPPEVRARS